MMSEFLGIDHVDVRVPSLAEVEAFYDRLMPALGLVRKGTAHVAADGEWHKVSPEHPRNAIEFYEVRPRDGSHARFIGFIEDVDMRPTRTRIAFRVAAREDVEAWEPRLREMGARFVECADDFATYPAVFFEDPCGTRLEILSAVR
jgi:catechol 2,3-dioxygenase-like lactoylglutathione lyase family enzyme